MNAWIKAFRLRTLLLAFSCIIMGIGLAVADGVFNLSVFLLSLITALLLQILSNLANDYGDFVKGTDNDERVGQERVLQAGLLNKKQMLQAIWVVTIFCIIFGVWLIYEGIVGLGFLKTVLFIIFGIVAIIAAIKYTIGKKPYGYTGFGDLFVFIFFGLLGVLGSYYLQAHNFYWKLLLAASAVGLLITAVLNINNMRDHIADRKNLKRTFVVLIGINNAKIYHQLLIIGAFILSILFVLPTTNYLHFGFLLTVPLFVEIIYKINKYDDYSKFDPLLKQQVIYTFLFVILFVVGINY